MNHASGAVAPPDAQAVQVGDAIGQRAERRRLVQGAVRPVPVPDQGPVQQLTPAAANPAFHDRIHPRRLNGGADNPDARSLEHSVERSGEAGVPVMQHELHPRAGILQGPSAGSVPAARPRPGRDAR
jgi:hypothetical protein